MKPSINLNKELDDIFNHDLEYTWCIVRHLTTTICQCLTQSPMIKKPGSDIEIPNPNYRTSPNPECANCEGSGRVFNEYLHKCQYFFPGYRWAHYGYEEEAMTAKNIYSIYLLGNESTHLINPNDWFFEVKRELDGSLTKPITRLRKMIIKEVQKYHLDSDKLEYVRLFATPSVV